MIKIKDYIFNENDIRRIYYNKDENCLCVGFRDKDLITKFVDNATFEDIEWNYEDEQIRKCLDSIDREKELEVRIKELEEENKKLNELVQFNVKTTATLTKRINKAIEYIEENKQLFMFDNLRKDGTLQYTIECDADDLLKMLKGVENESN